jgi:hypothetical protein
MKTIQSLKEEAVPHYVVLAHSSKSSKEFKAAKRKVDFMVQCIALIESGLTDETINRKVAQMNDQYARMKLAFYEEFTKIDPHTGVAKKPKLSRFHKESGAGKLRTQLKTFKFLQ